MIAARCGVIGLAALVPAVLLGWDGPYEHSWEVLPILHPWPVAASFGVLVSLLVMSLFELGLTRREWTRRSALLLSGAVALVATLAVALAFFQLVYTSTLIYEGAPRALATTHRVFERLVVWSAGSFGPSLSVVFVGCCANLGVPAGPLLFLRLMRPAPRRQVILAGCAYVPIVALWFLVLSETMQVHIGSLCGSYPLDMQWAWKSISGSIVFLWLATALAPLVVVRIDHAIATTRSWARGDG